MEGPKIIHYHGAAEKKTHSRQICTTGFGADTPLPTPLTSPLESDIAQVSSVIWKLLYNLKKYEKSEL